MTQPDPKVDAFLDRAKHWREEMKTLRRIVLQMEFTETLKWGKPVYTIEQRNVLALGPFKHHVALLMFNGALLDDPQKLLFRPTENTQAGRQLRFTSLQQIRQRTPVIKTYLANAIVVERAGLKVPRLSIEAVPVPAELQARFKTDRALKAAFETLTPGRRRAYLLHFAAAKQAATRQARIDRFAPRILDGKGITD